MKFSIRDVLWLTAVVALGLSWLATSRAFTAAKQRFDHDLGRKNAELLVQNLRLESTKQRLNERFVENRKLKRELAAVQVKLERVELERQSEP